MISNNNGIPSSRRGETGGNHSSMVHHANHSSVEESARAASSQGALKTFDAGSRNGFTSQQ